MSIEKMGDEVINRYGFLGSITISIDYFIPHLLNALGA